jgi:hypothetical protein
MAVFPKPRIADKSLLVKQKHPIDACNISMIVDLKVFPQHLYIFCMQAFEFKKIQKFQFGYGNFEKLALA